MVVNKNKIIVNKRGNDVFLSNKKMTDEEIIACYSKNVKLLQRKLGTYKEQCQLLQKALTLAIKKLKKLGYAFGEKEIIEEVEK